MSKTPILALTATGLLLLSALTVPALAKPGEDGPGPADRRDPCADAPANSTRAERCAAAHDKRDEMRAKADERREAMREKCAAADENSTKAKRCEALNKTAPAAKARREAHALVKAIAAHERILGRIDFKLDMLKAEQASGNYTGNHTADSVAHAIEKLEMRHDKVVEKIHDLRERLAALKTKWAEARDLPEDEAEDDAEVPA